MQSWSSQTKNIMDTIILMGSCSLANSGGTLMTMWHGLSPHRDLTISTNPGGCLPLADGIFLLWLYLQDQGDWWTHHLGSGCGFWSPYAMAHHKCTSGSSPIAPAVASFLSSWGICRLQHLQGHDFDPDGGWAVIQNLCIWSEVPWLIRVPACSPPIGETQLVLESLGVGQGLLGLLHTVVLSTTSRKDRNQSHLKEWVARGVE